MLVPKRRTAILALAAALAALAPGCGDDAKPTAERGSLERAADATRDVRGVRIHMRMRTEGGPVPVNVDADGVVEPRTRAAHMRMDMRAMRDALAARGQDVGDREAWRSEVVMKDLVMYMRFPPLAEAAEQRLDEDVEWIRMDLNKPFPGAGGVNFGDFIQSATSDPSQVLDQVRAMSSEIERVGRERVGGLETTRYRGKVAMRKLPDIAPPDRRERLRETIERLIETTGAPEEYPQDVWVDDRNLVRRLHQTMEFHPPGQPEMTQNVTLDFSDFGMRVRVEAPTEDVVDFSDLNAAGGG